MTELEGGGGARRSASASVLVELDEEECAELLATAEVGRIAVLVDGRPEIFPVSPVYDPADGSVSFPTNPSTRLHAAVDWPFAAFEVDGVVPGEHGWSVLVVGRAEEVIDLRDVEDLAARRSSTWSCGANERWIRIVPTKTTGRRIVAFDRLPCEAPSPRPVEGQLTW